MAGRRAADMPERMFAMASPASGAVVMGTGSVSIALSLDGQETASRVLLVLDGVIWVILAVLLATRAARDRARFCADVRTPAALTSVAGTAVLGTGLTAAGWDWAGIMLLAIGLVLWAALLAPVLRNWITPTVGSSLMLTVSTASLAVLAATIAAHEDARWLLAASLALFLLGLGAYAFAIRSFDVGQIALGRGDHWITGGALAISTLAAAHITLVAGSLHTFSAITDTLKIVSLALWALTIAWLPALLAGELLRPRLRYDVQRWSTVFPVGMYAACSFVVGAAAHAPAITAFARICVWAGVAVWLWVFLGMLTRGRYLIRREGPGLPGRTAGSGDA